MFSVMGISSPKNRVRKCSNLLLSKDLVDQNNLKTCKGILNKVELKFNEKKSDELSLSFLQTFQRLYSSWFPAYQLNLENQDFTNLDYYNVDQMSYSFLAALTIDNFQLKDIFKLNKNIFALRNHKDRSKYFLNKNIFGEKVKKFGEKKWHYETSKYTGKAKNPYEKVEHLWKPRLQQTGRLIGLTIQKKYDEINFFEKRNNKNIKYKVNHPFGGGIIGTSPYIQMTSRKYHDVMDGGKNIHRGWSKNIFKHFFCRNFPVLSSEDVEKKIFPKSKIAFRKSKACMTCHHTIDPLAGLVRNIYMFNTAEEKFDFLSIKSTYQVGAKYPYSKDPINTDDKYPFRKPEGDFNYRNLEGKLEYKHLKSLDQFGDFIANHMDFYRCTVSKHLKFLTGHEFELENIYKNQHPLVKYIDQQATELRKHQSLKKLMENIFQSSYFNE